MKKKVRVPRQQRSIETRTRIMDAGIELFSTKGYYNTNTNEIARAAGVAIGSFYAYFKDKKALFLEIMQSHWEEQFSKIKLPPENLEDPPVETKEMIYNLLKSLVEIHDVAPAFHQEQYAVAHTDDDVRKKIEEWDRIGLEIIMRYLEKWKDHLRIKDLAAAALIWSKTMEENIHLIRFSNTEVEAERLINELTDMLNEYLFRKVGS